MKTKTLALITVAVLLTGAAATQTQTQRSIVSMEPILISTDPAPVQSGEDADITFKLRNTGNSPAEDVEVQIVDSFPFRLKPDRKRNYSLGTVRAGQEYHISSEVLVADNAPDGKSSLEIKVTTEGLSYTQKLPIQVQSRDIELNLANLQTAPTTLTPDTEDATMTLEVVNNGEKAAENVVVNTELPEDFRATSSFSTRQSLGNIQPGQVKPAEFTFDIEEDAESGTVNIPTDITYSADSDSSTSRITEEADFSFHLSARPQFEVEEVESSLEAGGTGEISVEVRNTGGEESASTRIRVLDSSDQPFSYNSASKYVGTLEPNQTGTAVFEVDTESGAAVKDYLIDFEIRGVRDTQTYVEDTTVRASVEQGAENSNGSPLPFVAVILIAAGGAYYFRDRIREAVGR